MKNIWNKIKTVVKENKGLTSIGTVDIASSGIGALFWFYIAIILDAEQYGQISYFIAIASIASTSSLLGSQNTLTVYTAKNVKIQSTIYFITTISGLVASLIVFLIFQETVISLLVICYVIFNLSISEILGRRLFVTYAKYIIVNKILTVCLSIGLFYLIGFQGIILGIAFAYFPYIIRIYHGFKDTKIDFKLLKPRFRFMMTSYLTYLSDAFGGSIDKIIIAPLLGFVLLGNYALGIQFLSILSIIPAIVYKFVLPHDATGNPNKKLKKITIVISAVIAVISIIVSPILVPIIFPQYTEVVGVIQIVSISLVPSTVSLMYMSKFLGHENNKIILIGAIFYLVIQMVSIIILGKLFGTNGAAAALDISAVSHMIFYIIADRVIKDKKN